jgi:hypothetical protein
VLAPMIEPVISFSYELAPSLASRRVAAIASPAHS